MPAFPEALHRAAVRRYAGCSRYTRRFVHHKLRLDPVFGALMSGGRLPDRGIVYDLGCGYGILPAVLAAAAECHERGEWPAGWPPPPRQIEVRGVELDPRRAAAARKALGERARIEQGDVRAVRLERCAAIVVLDVMLYLDPCAQGRLLAADAAALEPGGILILREADAGAGLSFHVTRWAERLAALARARPLWRLHYRRAGEWARLLESTGFEVESENMSEGTPFANVLHTARRGVRPME